MQKDLDKLGFRMGLLGLLSTIFLILVVFTYNFIHGPSDWNQMFFVIGLFLFPISALMSFIAFILGLITLFSGVRKFKSFFLGFIVLLVFGFNYVGLNNLSDDIDSDRKYSPECLKVLNTCQNEMEELFKKTGGSLYGGYHTGCIIKQNECAKELK